MNVYPDIISTPIIDSSTDSFWNEAPQLHGFTPRPVLIISASYNQGSAEEEQLTTLVRSGCKLNPEQYNIVQLGEGQKLAWYRLRDQMAPRVLLLFNIMPAQLGIASLFNLNGINRFDGAFWVPTLSLTHLIQDKAMKGQLWNNALKPLFETKTHGELL